MPIKLIHIKSSNADKIELFNKDKITIGRALDNDIKFDPYKDLATSGKHAEIEKTNGCWFIKDLNSRNGTIVNGIKVDKTQVKLNDIIEFGINGPILKIIDLDEAKETQNLSPKNNSQQQSSFIGKKTVSMMINDALNQAKQRPSLTDKSTTFIKAIAFEAAKNSSKRFKFFSFFLFFIFIILIGLLGLFSYKTYNESLSQKQIIANQINLIKEQQAVLKQHEEKLQTTDDKISKVKNEVANIGVDIAEKNSGNIYMIVSEEANRINGLCTGFSVTANVIATNAHCIKQIENYIQTGANFSVIQNKSSGVKFSVNGTLKHPSYVERRDMPSADIGLIRVNGTLPSVVSLGNESDYYNIKVGDSIFVFGFPGNLMNPVSPVATLTQGIIGRVTNFDGSSGQVASTYLVQHSAYATKGTSGSPVFNTNGKVIAINTGYYTEIDNETIIDPVTGISRNFLITQRLNNYSFGIRIDLLNQIINTINQ